MEKQRMNLFREKQPWHSPLVYVLRGSSTEKQFPQLPEGEQQIKKVSSAENLGVGPPTPVGPGPS